jgi:hypothetical protein
MARKTRKTSVRKVSRSRSTARRTTARRGTARRTAARRGTSRRTTARRGTVRRSTTTARRTAARRGTSRRRVTKRRVSNAKPVATPSVAKPKPNADLAAMYLTILIVGVAGIILLFANPTATMQKVIGILLVILGLWGLMMKK